MALVAPSYLTLSTDSDECLIIKYCYLFYFSIFLFASRFFVFELYTNEFDHRSKGYPEDEIKI